MLKIFPDKFAGEALELGSGTGAHVELFAQKFPSLTWQPTEFIPELAGSGGTDFGVCFTSGPEVRRALLDIDSVCRSFPNVRPATHIDASEPFDKWPSVVREKEGTFSLVFIANVFHITPWEVAKGALAGAGRALRQGGLFIVYGPFKVNGEFTTESNYTFDANLRTRNPLWGYRDISQIRDEAAKHGFTMLPPEMGQMAMPANNFMLAFAKQTTTPPSL